MAAVGPTVAMLGLIPMPPPQLNSIQTSFGGAVLSPAQQNINWQNHTKPFRRLYVAHCAPEETDGGLTQFLNDEMRRAGFVSSTVAGGLHQDPVLFAATYDKGYGAP